MIPTDHKKEAYADPVPTIASAIPAPVLVKLKWLHQLQFSAKDK